MEVRDYNGAGEWSLEGIRKRYRDHARAIGLSEDVELVTLETSDGEVRWVYPVMYTVIERVEKADMACIELAVEFIERGPKQDFGRILHSNAARALRRAPLTAGQKDRLRTTILGMLARGWVPHEFRQYAKLLRRIGLGKEWAKVRGELDVSNRYVMRWVRYFDACAAAEPSGA